MNGIWIDVRSPGEYAAGHVPGSLNIPLDQVEARVADMAGRGPVTLICQSGKRADICAKLLAARGFDGHVRTLEGGIARWTGEPLVRSVRTRWSLERQVRLGAGAMILASLALAWLVHPAFVGLTVFAGAGLTFAGLTDICLMGSLLAKMPWNGAATVKH